MDETYIKIKGKWFYYYRAVDKAGKTIDFYLSEKRDEKAARRFFEKAIASSGKPEKVNIDKSGANLAALTYPMILCLKKKGSSFVSLRFSTKSLNRTIGLSKRLPSL